MYLKLIQEESLNILMKVFGEFQYTIDTFSKPYKINSYNEN